MTPRVLSALLDRAVESGNLDQGDLLTLLGLTNIDDIRLLLKAADIVREREVGDEVHIRGLIEFSNYCRKTCSYCGLRSGNIHVKRYRMTPDEIVDLAISLDDRGIRTAVLQSGEDPWFSGCTLAEVVREIKAKTDMAVTLSVGERSREDYALWHEAGADRYLLRHETINSQLFDAMQTKSTIHHRLQCIEYLKELGYQVGIGFMVGLPGQTNEDLAADLLFVKDLQPDMLGIGPFIPSPDTPLGDQPGGTLEMSLKCVALGRIVTRNALIPATTAMGTIDEYGREKALEAGANVVMPNYTPLGRRENYTIYPNKRCIGEDPDLCHGCLTARILGLGRKISTGRGDSPKKQTVSSTCEHGLN